MRVQVLTPWWRDGVDQPVGSFVEVDEPLVRALKGTLSQEDIPNAPGESERSPAGDPAGGGGDVAAGADANAVREEV
ncbi:hypothetical protein FHP25_24995 [Vineibacter terrae]|uniref:Uncharacterized protein n=1 Tax=Vineibacter terrae TaxID=2586908 RepID=A0A5C8PG04_9HYPH|nr:hypothetical protein [Vineibacter terrae]TXL72556.1 hypothetical protein FHP25_24995 [Vineibacter terrae]